MALASETIVHTLCGDRRLYDLADQETHVFTWTGRKISVGRIYVVPDEETAWTRRIVLDSGTSFRATSDQVILTRTGNMVDARYAAAGTSVMPLYLSRKKKGGYPIYRQLSEDRKTAKAPSDRKTWRSVARMVYEWRSGDPIPPGMFVRFIDNAPKNCHPDNLRLEGKRRDRNKDRQIEQLKQLGRRKAPNNHKVVGQEQYAEEPVMRVIPQDCDNFAAGEVFLMGAYGAES